MNWSDELVDEVPPAVVTVTWTVPEACGGAIAMSVVADFTWKLAGSVPNLTAVAAVRLVPVMVTTVPPAVLPPVRLSPVTVGALAAV